MRPIGQRRSDEFEGSESRLRVKMIGRRLTFGITLLLGALVSPSGVESQPVPATPRVGYLAADLASGIPNRDAFLQGLRDLGYSEGRNVLIEYRDAERRVERLPALAAELVALKVDVIVAAGGTADALAAKQSTSTLPVVFTGVGDPVADGLVIGLSRPGGNVTGLSLVGPELVGKLLELLKQAVPGVSRVALLLKPDAPPDRMKLFLKAADVAAQSLGVRLQVVEARGPEDFDRAFADMSKARAGALAVLATAVFSGARQRLVDLAVKNRLPTVFAFKEYVEVGGLMSYGPDLVDLSRRASIYVDKILKGAKPGDLPVEQPTKFELVINLKTAKTLGLTIPPAVLARADRVIEK